MLVVQSTRNGHNIGPWCFVMAYLVPLYYLLTDPMVGQFPLLPHLSISCFLHSSSLFGATIYLFVGNAYQRSEMELRKVEQELELLSSEWKAVRRKQPKFDDDTSSDCSNEALYKIMPSWKDLKAKVNDDELFPQYDEDEDNEEEVNMIENVVVDGANQDESGKGTNNMSNTEDAPTVHAEDTGAYSEFGMCIVAPSNGNEEESKNKDNTESSTTNGGSSIFERYAAKNTVTAKSKVNVPQKQTTSTSTEDESSDEEDEMVEDAYPMDVLARLESLQGRFNDLEPKIDKFKAKLRDVSTYAIQVYNSTTFAHVSISF